MASCAACRAVRDALWRNSINAAELFGVEKEDMILDVRIGVQRPEAVDIAAVAAIFPYGKAHVGVVEGGLQTRDGEPLVHTRKNGLRYS